MSAVLSAVSTIGCHRPRPGEAVMTPDAPETPAIDVRNLQEFFRDAVHDALARQHVGVDDHTEHYVVNLLTMFARSEALFEQTREGPRLKPLALMLAEAVDAPCNEQRSRTLQRLGDVSLFVAGFLSHGFARRLVDVDYHIAMGGRAYGALAQSAPRGPRRVLATVFAELEDKFQPLVDALNDISDSAAQHSQRDLLRLYELWHRTGSRRAHRLLMRLGIQPLATGSASH
jgi:hypothetical protein